MQLDNWQRMRKININRLSRFLLPVALLLLHRGVLAGAASLPDQLPGGALPVVLDAISEGLPAAFDWQPVAAQPTLPHRVHQASNDRQRQQYRVEAGTLRLALKGIGSADYALAFRLAGYGRAGAVRSAGDVLHTEFPQGNQLRQHYAGELEEWFVNSPFGLEHGFTLNRPPAGDDGQPVVLALAVSGDLLPRVDADALGVSYLTPQGEPVFGYRGLVAFDSTGRRLPVSMTAGEGRLHLQVDAAGAVYPVTVDPLFATEQVHYANDPVAADDQFGYSVAIDGDWMAIGAPFDDDRGTDAGAVYLFVRTGSEVQGLQWSLFSKYRPASLTTGDNFGHSVALSGNVLVVGAYKDDNVAGIDAGAAYIYEYESPYWNQKTTLTGSVLSTNHWFGYSTEIFGGLVMVGAPRSFTSPADPGDVYIFSYDTSTNTASQTTRLYPTSGQGGAAGDHFGFSIGYDGKYLAIGAPYDDTDSSDAGAVYIYTSNKFGWSLDDKITLGATAGTRDYFGRALDIDGNMLVAAAPYSDVHAGDAGAVFVYLRSTFSPYDWYQDASLTPKQADNSTSDVGGLDFYGSAVAIERDSNGSGVDYILVGSPYNDDAGTNSGSAYLYSNDSGSWEQLHKLTAGNTANSLEEFGKAVAIDARTAVVGAPKADGGFRNGRVHSFGTQAQTALYLTLSSNSLQAGGAVNITAQIKVGGLPPGSSDLAGKPVEIVVRDPAGALAYYGGGYTDTQGTVALNGVNVFSQNGTYTVQAAFDNASLPLPKWTTAVSGIENIVVNAHAGYAVIIEGGIAAPDTLGEDSHNKTAGRIYQTLLDRGFTDDKIFYFNQVTGDPARPGVDATPTLANLDARLITDANSLLNQVAALPGPVHFFPIDHGAPGGRFFLNPGTGGLPEELSPAMLAGWLDALEAVPAMQNWPVTVNLAACYSGGFLPGLSDPASPRRVLITSARENEEAFKGPQEQSPPRSGSFFLDELLNELERGRSFRDSFSDAAERTLVYTRADDTGLGAQYQYEDHALQHPLLDDNGDDQGTTLLSDGTVGGISPDGAFSANVYLGFGVTDNSDTHLVEDVVYISSPQNYLLALNPNGHSSGATIAVRAPGTDLNALLTGGTGTEQLTPPYTLTAMTYISGNYWVDYPFTSVGRWDVWYFLEDDPSNTTENGKFTAVKHTIVYVSGGGQIPGSFSLQLPASGEQHASTQQVFDWSVSVDPDGDAVTYELLVSTSNATNGNGELSSPDVRIADIPYSMQYVDRSYGLQDLTQYYWQVLAVDAFGNRRASPVRAFFTDDTNFPPAPLLGKVNKAGVTGAVDGAVVTLTPSGFAAQSDVDGSYYLEAPPDAYTATATKTSYVDATASVQLSYVGLPTVQDFALVTAAGDSDGDGFLDGVDNCPSIYNPGQWDYDQDGQGNACDANDDNDGLTDAQEAAAGTYPLDPDSDNDGSQDGTDAFPLNPSEQLDTDGDGTGNNADTDDDGDGTPDIQDCAPLDPALQVMLTTGVCVADDLDDDNDGVPDAIDAFPRNPNEQLDTDGDGIGNNADTDDDGDGTADTQDCAPLDPAGEILLVDGTTCVVDDADDDNDGTPDVSDAFPLDPAEQLDTDGDGLGDNLADPDADNDGVLNGVDTARLDPQVCADVDADLCDDCEIGVDGFGPLPDNDPANDGPDYNADGICDRSDPPLMADGDLNADGAVDAADVLLAHRMLMGQIPADLSRGDVAPLVGGVPASDGIFDLGDVLLIQRKALGQISF